MPTCLRFIFLLSLVAATSYGQTGHYFKTHYSPANERFDYVCFDMVQQDNGVIYFATKGGLLRFDGKEWDIIEDISAVFSLQSDANGKIYWAGSKGFGSITIDTRGQTKSEILSDSTVTNVFQTLIVNDDVFFLTAETLFRLGADGHITRIEPATRGDLLLKAFELKGTLHLSTDNGIYRLDGKVLVDAGLDLTASVVFAEKLNDTYIIATTDNKLHALSPDGNLKPLPKLQDETYLNASVIVSGAWLNRQLLALGTLRGGVVFINPLNGLTQEISNYNNGLPDNEVFALMADVNHNVWVGHDYGFTKISPYIPLSTFNHYPGLEGNLLSVYNFQGRVYVGTSLGLFRLDKVELYDELVYYVNVPVRTPGRAAETSAPAPLTGEAATHGDSKRRGMFGLFKRKRSDDESTETVTPESEERTSTPTTTFRRERRLERVLRSAQYEYKKVQGINAKVSQLAEVDGRLVAAGLGGLYEVKGLTAESMMDEPIRHIFSPAKKDFLVVSTYNDDVRILRFLDRYVENTSLYSALDDQIHDVFEGAENDLWLCGVNRIYRARAEGGDVRHKQTITLAKPNTDKTTGVLIQNQVVIAMAQGFFRYDETKKSLVKIDSIPHTSQHFAYNNNIIYRDEHGWTFLSPTEKEANLQLLNVFTSLRFIGADAGGSNLWLISGGNDLYKFFGNRVTPLRKEFPLLLKSIVHQDKRIGTLKEIIIDQVNSAVMFEVVRPDFVNPAAVEYRYWLEGMQETWSPWSVQNNVISFPYLPTGNYKLHVEARNIFGRVSNLEPMVFEVLPPYWKRPLFYALEFSIFASLVMLSFRLSQRYRFVSRLLSLLTIILLIEFIQTAINANFVTEESPVIDFVIQVVVAFMILPVEGYLRNLMLRSLDSSGKLYQFLVPGKPDVVFKGKPEKFVRETSDKL